MSMQYQKILSLISGVNALLCEKDKKALYKYSSMVMDGGVIVDVGTAAGGSAFIMGLSSKPNVKLHTIDPVYNESFIHYLEELKLTNKVIFHNETSLEFSKQWNDPIDLLFVDGVHSYQGVKEDFENIGKNVKREGIIIFHDIYLYENTIGACVKELIEKELIKPIEYIDDTYNDDRHIGMLVSEKL